MCDELKLTHPDAMIMHKTIWYNNTTHAMIQIRTHAMMDVRICRIARLGKSPFAGGPAVVLADCFESGRQWATAAPPVNGDFYVLPKMCQQSSFPHFHNSTSTHTIYSSCTMRTARKFAALKVWGHRQQETWKWVKKRTSELRISWLQPFHCRDS